MENISFKIGDVAIKIINSYQIKKRSRIKEILYVFKLEHSDIKFDRDINLLVKEWIVHNRLYKLGLFRNRTKDVDLEYQQKWYLKVMYWILGI